MSRLICRIGLLASIIFTTASRAATFEWDAAWEWYPNDLIPGMTLFDSAPLTTPVLENGSLRITTLAVSENMGYLCTGTNFVAPGTLIIEARMRVLTNYSEVIFRAAAVVGFTMSPNIGNALFIGRDEIFIGNGHASRGTPVAVDTDDAFHTYRVEVDGAGATSAVRVYQDGTLRLTGTLYDDVPDNGSLPRVFFGEGSIHTHGTNLWTRFSHNGAAQISSVRPVLSMTPITTLGLHGLPGRNYQIDSTTNLNDPSWSFRMNLTLPLTNAFGSTNLTPPLLPHEFFRAFETP